MIRNYAVLSIKLINTREKIKSVLFDAAMDGLDGNTPYPVGDIPVSLDSVLCGGVIFADDVGDS